MIFPLTTANSRSNNVLEISGEIDRNFNWLNALTTTKILSRGIKNTHYRKTIVV